MPRSPDPDKRADLLRAVVAHLEVAGINDLSLAPLAEAVGTSKRMLLYYFGDRGQLIAQVLESCRPDAGELFSGTMTRDELADAAMRLWHALSRGKQRRAVRILLQVLSLSTTDPETYGDYARSAVDAMLTPATAAFEAVGFDRRQAAVRATLVVSGLRGLCQDLLVTSDRGRLDAAARMVVDAAVFGGP